MKFYDNGENQVFAKTSIPEDYQSYPGIVHGGVLASILDEAIGRVAMINDHHHFMMSMNLQVKYRHSVPTNTEISVIAERIRISGKSGKAKGAIYLPNSDLACEAEMSMIDMPDEKVTDSLLEKIDWKICPDV